MHACTPCRAHKRACRGSRKSFSPSAKQAGGDSRLPDRAIAGEEDADRGRPVESARARALQETHRAYGTCLGKVVNATWSSRGALREAERRSARRPPWPSRRNRRGGCTPAQGGGGGGHDSGAGGQTLEPQISGRVLALCGKARWGNAGGRRAAKSAGSVPRACGRRELVATRPTGNVGPAQASSGKLGHFSANVGSARVVAPARRTPRRRPCLA